MMNRACALAVLLLSSVAAFAQVNEEEGFFDTYMPIAKLFDSPLFFGVVVGSAVLLLLAAAGFVIYAGRLEKRAAAWAAGLSPRERVERVGSPVHAESRLAFVYLRKHAQEPEIQALIEILDDQRKTGKIDPNLIYLLEDLRAAPAIPILQQIANGKSRFALLAARALEHITADEETAVSAKA
ncbi:MAG: hypothetical protein ACE15F_00355 [bacterium]